jgi:geranylgeranyl pyrophosphate synthase
VLRHDRADGRPRFDGDWARRRDADLHVTAKELVRQYAASPEQRAALEAVAATLQPNERWQTARSFHLLPLLTYAASRGDDAPALRLAAALALYGRGIGILDDLADGDRKPFWGEHTASEMVLTAHELIAGLPQVVVADLGAPPTVVSAMQRDLALGFLRACAGQRRDLELRGVAGVSAADAEACAAAKAGSVVEVLATLGARLGGAAPAAVDAFGTFGRALGTALSIAEDCLDLFVAEQSSDLRNGARSFPIALHLQRLSGEALTAALDLLDRASRDSAAEAIVRQGLREAGELRHSAAVVALHCQRARLALAKAAPPEPVLRALEAIVEAVPFAPTAGATSGQRE